MLILFSAIDPENDYLPFKSLSHHDNFNAIAILNPQMRLDNSSYTTTTQSIEIFYTFSDMI